MLTESPEYSSFLGLFYWPRQWLLAALTDYICLPARTNTNYPPDTNLNGSFSCGSWPQSGAFRTRWRGRSAASSRKAALTHRRGRGVIDRRYSGICSPGNSDRELIIRWETDLGPGVLGRPKPGNNPAAFTGRGERAAECDIVTQTDAKHDSDVIKTWSFILLFLYPFSYGLDLNVNMKTKQALQVLV